MVNKQQDKLEKGIESGLRIKPYFHFDTEEAWQSFCQEMDLPYKPTTIVKPYFTRLDLFKYAAAILVIFAVFTMITRPVKFTETVTTKERGKFITLFEGSGIEMAGNTTIQYPVRSDGIVVRRVVIESGKATFNVQKHALPFIVSAYPLEIKVTGTTFTVEKTAAGVIIIQHEGRVEVRKPNESLAPVVLQKGEKMKMYGGEMYFSQPKQDYVLVSSFTWAGMEKADKIGMKALKNQESDSLSVLKVTGLTYQMKDVITFLDKKYKKKIRFKKKRRLKSKDTVNLTLTEPLDKILESLQKQGKIVFEKRTCEGCFLVSPPPKK